MAGAEGLAGGDWKAAAPIESTPAPMSRPRTKARVMVTPPPGRDTNRETLPAASAYGDCHRGIRRADGNGVAEFLKARHLPVRQGEDHREIGIKLPALRRRRPVVPEYHDLVAGS